MQPSLDEKCPVGSCDRENGICKMYGDGYHCALPSNSDWFYYNGFTYLKLPQDTSCKPPFADEGIFPDGRHCKTVKASPFTWNGIKYYTFGGPQVTPAPDEKCPVGSCDRENGVCKIYRDGYHCVLPSNSSWFDYNKSKYLLLLKEVTCRPPFTDEGEFPDGRHCKTVNSKPFEVSGVKYYSYIPPAPTGGKSGKGDSSIFIYIGIGVLLLLIVIGIVIYFILAR